MRNRACPWVWPFANSARAFAGRRCHRQRLLAFIPQHISSDVFAARFREIADLAHQGEIDSGWKQSEKFVGLAVKHEGIDPAQA
jgi:hypothetical protein